MTNIVLLGETMAKKTKKCPDCDYEGEMLYNQERISKTVTKTKPESISYTKTYYCPKCKHWKEIQ